MKKKRAYSYGDGALIRRQAAEALAAAQAQLPDDDPNRWCWTKEEAFEKCAVIDPRATVPGFRTYCLKNARDKRGNLRRNPGVVRAVLSCVVPGLYDEDGNPTMGRAAFKVKVAMMKLIASGVRHKYDNQAVLARDLGVGERALYAMLCENDNGHHFNREIFELSKQLFVEGYWDLNLLEKLELQKLNREQSVLDYVVLYDIAADTKHEFMKIVGGAAGYSYRTLKHKGYDACGRQKGGPALELAIQLALENTRG
ncbi:MAG: hypothetical protein LBL46_01035 [Rickettsiales bacterium]|jgi:hypothetical protein|nr:hypothetical protein [Rickettsiales bacterium]